MQNTIMNLKDSIKKWGVIRYPRPRVYMSIISSIISLCYYKDTSRDKLTKQINSFWNSKRHMVITYSVRTSFDLILRVLNLPNNSEVLMSAINIPDMEELVLQHGLIPIPVDLDPNTLVPSIDSFKARMTKRSKIFLAAHLCGSTFDMQPFIDICREQSIFVIEDCAQAFGYDGWAGHESADASLFSFGPAKYATALGGSCSFIKDSNIAKKIIKLESSYPVLSRTTYSKRIFKYFLLSIYLNPIIYTVIINIFTLKSQHNNKGASFPSTAAFNRSGAKELTSYIRFRPSISLLYLMKKMLFNNVPHRACIKRRIYLCRNLLEKLDNTTRCLTASCSRNTFWALPIYIANHDQLNQKLYSNGYEAMYGMWYYISKKKEIIFKKQDIAEIISQSIIDIPIYENYSDVDITQLAEIIKSCSE